MIIKYILSVFYLLNSYLKDLRRRIFKTDEHPNVAASLSCIADQYSNLGDYRNALEQYEKVLGRSYNNESNL